MLSEELRRRLLHMDGLHTDQERTEIMKALLQKMLGSGYRHRTRKEVIKSACGKFSRQLIEEYTEGRKVYRSVEDKKTSRRMKSLQIKKKMPFHPHYHSIQMMLIFCVDASVL